MKQNAKAKFDETVEMSMNLGIDPRHADQMVRGLTSLPNGTGKTVRVGVFARGPKADEAQAAGADVVGAEDLAEKVQAGDIAFDRCIATPDMMGVVGRLGKILGPRGLMPNPRLGTVTMDVKGAVTAAKGGQVEFRAEKAGIIHAGIGKVSFEDDKLVENARALADAIQKAKPTGAKGTYVQKVVGELDHGARRAGGCELAVGVACQSGSQGPSTWVSSKARCPGSAIGCSSKSARSSRAMLRALGSSLPIASDTNRRRLGLSSSRRSICTRWSASIPFEAGLPAIPGA